MFKKIQIILIVCVLFIGILPSLGLEAKATQQVTEDGFSYKLTADGKGMIITGYDYNASPTPVIPNEIEGKPVVEIGNSAFLHREITALTIPNSVTSIGENAFMYTTKLATLNIPNSVTSIGNRAFEGATGLTSITIPNSVTNIGEYAFLGATELKEVEIPNSIDTIKEGIFAGATALTNVTIPNSVKTIGDGVFSGAKSLTSIDIPNSVTSIGRTAFAYTDKLTHINIPNSMTYIGNLTFYEATGLTSISIPNSVTLIGSSAFLDATALKTIEIPNSVKSIGYGAFQGATGLTHVDLPNGLDSIGDLAFQNATALTHVDLPHSLDYIGKQAFSGATSLKSIKFNTPVTYLGENVFEDVPNGLKVIGFNGSLVENYINDGNISSPDKYIFEGSEYEVTAEDFGYTLTDDGEGVIITSYDDNISLKPKIPSEIEGKPVVGIDSYVFFGSEITEITIPNSVTSIGEGALAEATGLTNIILPNNLKSIGNYAFEDATGLKSIEIPNSVESIGNSAFSGMTGLMSITLPNNLKSLGNEVFKGTTELASITIPNSVESIGDFAFEDAVGLISLTLPDSLESIGESAFSGVTGITSIEIPKSVTSIDDYAFDGAISLKTIKFNTPSIFIGEDIFYGIPDGLKVIGFKDSRLEKYINDSNEESAGRFIFEGAEYKLKDSDFSYELTANGQGAIITGYNDSVLSNPIIPSTFAGKPVVEIGESAFYDSEITGITIPKTVKHIGKAAFEDARSLRSVEIPNGVVSIGDYAFEDTRKLTSITIPNSVKHIGEGAFEDARILASIEIPNSVETIGDCAFEDMRALKTIKFHNPLTTLGEDVFKDVPEGLKVIGFKGSKVEAYIKLGNDASPGRFIFEALSNKITFNSNGGTKITSANTNEKGLATQPKAPTKANHLFEGWYTDTKYKTKWDFKNPVHQSMTLYAKWSPTMGKLTEISDTVTQIKGTTSPNSAVRIVQGSKEIGKGKSDTKGNFTIKISKVKAGSTVEIQVTDAYGIKKSFEKTVADKTAPKVTVPKVNAANTKIVGTAEAKSKIELVINGKVTKATTSAKGKYSISIKKQKAGTKMTLTVSDAAGNKTKKTITVLAAPKAVTLASISDKQDTITGKTEAKAKVKIYVNNKFVKTVTANSKGTYSYKVGKKKAGTAIKVIATDQAGNATTKTVKVLDKTAPAKPSVKNVKASSTTVVGKAEAGSTVYVYKGKTLLGKATTSSKGNYTVKIKKQKKGTTLLVKAQDKAKNMSKNTSVKVK